MNWGTESSRTPKTQLEKAIEAMGLDNCAINADFILKDDKTYVLELGGRSGATCLAELVSIYYGFDYYEKLVLAALGEDVAFPQEHAVPNASMLLRSNKDGVIRSIENKNEPDGDIYEIQFDYGDRRSRKEISCRTKPHRSRYHKGRDARCGCREVERGFGQDYDYGRVSA